ncbi:MAG: RNB domain-containing ribonuclease [Deltaproteobacteria bacterium]|nr:RNB domain-containing ribonuclease [Deltaproteobacteria bacterium]
MPEPGQLVEFINERSIIAAVCLQAKGPRVLLLTENNKEVSLSAKRLLIDGPFLGNVDDGRGRLLQAMQTTVQKREELKKRVSTEDLWDLLNAETGPFSYRYLAELTFGETVTIHHLSAVCRAVFEDKLHFKMLEDQVVPNSIDKVEAIKLNLEREAAKERQIEQLAGILKMMVDSPDQLKEDELALIVPLLKEVAIFNSEAECYLLAKEVMQRANKFHPEMPFKLLVDFGIFDQDENVFLHRCCVPLGFSEELLSQACSLDIPPPRSCSDTVDLTSLPLITIDASGTRDHDDAISLERLPEGYRLGVHVIDVSRFIPKGSPLDREARERGTSIYLPDRRIPMLPEVMSEQVLSLLPNDEKPGVSVLVDLDQNFEIRSFQIVPSLITIHRQLTYVEADEMIGSDQDMTLLYEITRKFRQKRLESGAVDLSVPELLLWVDENKNITVKLISRESPTRMLISELMIMANGLMAQFAMDNGLPIPFRSQGEPRERVERPEGEIDLYLDYKQRRALNRFLLDITPEPHAGLGLPAYTNVTSPIRRYLDLIAQRQLMDYIREGKRGYQDEELKEIISVVKPAVQRANLVRQKRTRYWLLKHLSARVGDWLPAQVLDKSSHSYRMILEEYLFELNMPTANSIPLFPGDHLRVKLEKVNYRDDIIKVSV